MWLNASYIFFKELGPASSALPLGVRDIPLTEGRSLAVDAAWHGLGLPIFVSAPELAHACQCAQGFHRLMVAQDAGSAIRGPERGDIFFGTGEAAGVLAGKTRHAGMFHVLLPRQACNGRAS
ncbi:MAG TPA: 3D domain-containing protein, partial [Hyphomicrobiaceae bacterium]|nr:3D domain-containing protein [Hyphomicrobiaceae bacterium]